VLAVLAAVVEVVEVVFVAVLAAPAPLVELLEPELPQPPASSPPARIATAASRNVPGPLLIAKPPSSRTAGRLARPASLRAYPGRR
jgi:hypothetical protein